MGSHVTHTLEKGKHIKTDKMTKNESKVTMAREQVNQVTDIMKGNLEKIVEREGKLHDLESKADKLQSESQQFQKTVIKVKRKAWLQNMKMNLAIAGTILVLLIIIASVVAYSFLKHGNHQL